MEISFSERTQEPQDDRSVAQLVEEIGRKLKTHDDDAEHSQLWRDLAGVFALLLGPIAFTALAVAASAEEAAAKSPWLLLEICFLGFALLFGFLELGGSHAKWINRRMRAEILRRERQLLKARVGPYLRVPNRLLRERFDQRVQLIEGEEVDPVTLVPLVESDAVTWRDALEDAGADQQPVSNLAMSISEYRKERLVDQREWFIRKSRRKDCSSRWFERVARLVLVAAIGFAAYEFGVPLTEGNPTPNRPHFEWLHFAGLALPIVGALAINARSFFQSDRLARSYHCYGLGLAAIEDALRALELRIAGGVEATLEVLTDRGGRAEGLAMSVREPGVDSRAAPTVTPEHAFKRLVLRTEDLLSNELMQWWLAVSLAKPEAGT